MSARCGWPSTTWRKSSTGCLCQKASKTRTIHPAKLAGQLRYAVLEGKQAMAQAVGFYTDTTVCIGCKACQVACHQWNGLPAELAEQPSATRPGIAADYRQFLRQHRIVLRRQLAACQVHREERAPDRGDLAWLMMSDVCKHCVNAPCLEVCPTGAIMRTEFDTVYIQRPPATAAVPVCQRVRLG